MNDFEAIDQLLAAAAEPVLLPPAESGGPCAGPSVSRVPKWPAPSA
ncbi:hypothetical protein AB0D17_50935 [Streptomyces mirabilis]|nr:hypothetical protein [Streptomyces mirabilis]